MFKKDLNVGFLLDFYGDILSERKRDVLSMYYNEDLSLSEISEVVGISRQGARDIIKKAGDELLFYEEKLQLARRFGELRDAADKIIQLARADRVTDALRAEAARISSLLIFEDKEPHTKEGE